MRVGVDADLDSSLLTDFPPRTQIVRIPRGPGPILEVDFWILPFHRKDAAQTFARLRGVKAVQSMMAGVDWILPWLPPGITLCDGRGLHDISASEWVLSAILATLKRFPTYRDAQNKQQWLGQFARKDGFLSEPGPERGQYAILADDLSGKTALIVGFGSIGTAVESRLRPFGVNILRIARSARPDEDVRAIGALPDLLPRADIVILLLPLTSETRGLIGARELGLMKPGALLVNAARGPIVHTDALVDALSRHHLCAALDVTDPEPLPSGHPLWTAPHCLITPHIGGSTPEFICRAFRFGALQVARYAAGEPLENIVTAAGY